MTAERLKALYVQLSADTASIGLVCSGQDVKIASN